MRKKAAVAKVVMASIFVVALLFGGAALYYYESPQLIGATSTSSIRYLSSSGANPADHQDNSGRPFGTWANYLGFLPQGYSPAPHAPNAPNFPCPPEMSASACAQFKQTCGNGVCDPNETCATCAIDCGPTGNLVCDPYTGRPGQPSSVCQAVVGNNNFG